jgi:hypothetical protein
MIFIFGEIVFILDGVVCKSSGIPSGLHLPLHPKP